MVNKSTIEIEHRNLHSLYGFMSSLMTYEALQKREGDERPFILSRSFFPGSQRHCAIWSGDSNSTWDDFFRCAPILLQKSLCGISFVGGDVPGFYGDPFFSGTKKLDSKLYISFYRLGIFMPFFRAHAHIDSVRREPWMFDTTTLKTVRNLIVLRYKLLAYLYTQFYLYHSQSIPILRPLWFDHPSASDIDERSAKIFKFGRNILIKMADGKLDSEAYEVKYKFGNISGEIEEADSKSTEPIEAFIV
jgi:alpha 1,3-glucosidase